MSKCIHVSRLWLSVYRYLLSVQYTVYTDSIQFYTMQFTLLYPKTVLCATCRNFFELVRFDFVVNEDFHIFLMEVG